MLNNVSKRKITMFNKILVIAFSFTLAMSNAAYAGFTTSEYGGGENVTGTIGSSLLQSNSLGSLANSNLSPVITQIRSTGRATTFPPDAVVFDRNADGIITSLEVVQTLDMVSGINFTVSNAQQAVAILNHINGCTTVNNDCLQNTADAGTAFLDTALASQRSALLIVARAFATGTTALAVSSYPGINIFDTNFDGRLTPAEIVTLIGTDPSLVEPVIQPSGDKGLYARAYLEELAGGATIPTAVITGNDWAVYPPSVTVLSGVTLQLVGTDATPSTANNLPPGTTFTLRVTDGTCVPASVTTCTVSPTTVTHTITATHTSLAGVTRAIPGNPFVIDGTGDIVPNQSINIQNLEAGIYNLTVVSVDTNTTDTYQRSTTNTTLTVTILNENGCLLEPGTSTKNFNVSGDVSGAAVTIAGNHDPRYDKMFIKGATASSVRSDGSIEYANFPGHSGVRGVYTPSVGMMRFYGTKALVKWMQIFDLVGYIYNTSGSTSARPLIFSLSNKVPFLHSNGTATTADDTYHFYDYVAQRDIDHNIALTAAQNTKLLGMTGYLATITSQIEQDYVNPKVAGHGWLGACDDLDTQSPYCNYVVPSDASKRDEGEWYWIDGPEKGHYIGKSTGYPSDPPASNASSTGAWSSDGADSAYSYTNWASGEPNNVRGSCPGRHEDALHVWSWRKWNDFCQTSSRIAGYLIEWGGPVNTPWGQVKGAAFNITETRTYDPTTQGRFCAHQ